MTLPAINLDRKRSWPPRQTEFTRHFWTALAKGRFETTRCEDCRQLSFPPKQFCPHCWSTNVVWSELSGRGRLYSQTVVHAAPAVFRDETPYRVGIVDLREGLRVAMRIVSESVPALDAPVEVVVLNYSDGPLFAARPVA
jgi:uncharacterized OB-fold protein